MLLASAVFGTISPVTRDDGNFFRSATVGGGFPLLGPDPPRARSDEARPTRTTTTWPATTTIQLASSTSPRPLQTQPLSRSPRFGFPTKDGARPTGSREDLRAEIRFSDEIVFLVADEESSYCQLSTGDGGGRGAGTNGPVEWLQMGKKSALPFRSESRRFRGILRLERAASWNSVTAEQKERMRVRLRSMGGEPSGEEQEPHSSRRGRSARSSQGRGPATAARAQHGQSGSSRGEEPRPSRSSAPPAPSSRPPKNHVPHMHSWHDLSQSLGGVSTFTGSSASSSQSAVTDTDDSRTSSSPEELFDHVYGRAQMQASAVLESVLSESDRATREDDHGTTYGGGSCVQTSSLLSQGSLRYTDSVFSLPCVDEERRAACGGQQMGRGRLGCLVCCCYPSEDFEYDDSHFESDSDILMALHAASAPGDVYMNHRKISNAAAARAASAPPDWCHARRTTSTRSRSLLLHQLWEERRSFDERGAGGTAAAGDSSVLQLRGGNTSPSLMLGSRFGAIASLVVVDPGSRERQVLNRPGEQQWADAMDALGYFSLSESSEQLNEMVESGSGTLLSFSLGAPCNEDPTEECGYPPKPRDRVVQLRVVKRGRGFCKSSLEEPLRDGDVVELQALVQAWNPFLSRRSRGRRRSSRAGAPASWAPVHFRRRLRGFPKFCTCFLGGGGAGGGGGPHGGQGTLLVVRRWDFFAAEQGWWKEP